MLGLLSKSPDKSKLMTLLLDAEQGILQIGLIQDSDTSNDCSSNESPEFSKLSKDQNIETPTEGPKLIIYFTNRY